MNIIDPRLEEWRYCVMFCVATTGLSGSLRSEIQSQWMNGEVPVIVATISFGMGVDKANVR